MSKPTPKRPDRITSMRPLLSTVSTIVVASCAWGQVLPAQTSKPKAAAPATSVRPVRVDLLSLQVTKLPRDDFGRGIKPGTKEAVTFWLANSGTAVDLRFKLGRPVVRFDERASRLVRFADDQGSDLTRPPAGEKIDPFFGDNKPIDVRLGPEADEGEVVLRGYGTPAPGATKLRIDADLVFLSGSGERTAERKGVDLTPGSKVAIGPLHLVFRDPKQAGAAFGLPLAIGNDPAAMAVALDYERADLPIKEVQWLGPDGHVARTLTGEDFSRDRGGTVTFGMPKLDRVDVRVVYFEKAEVITVPLRLETGVGF